jgi:DNA repair exonuclease SbcCD ATPase subunit
VRAQLASLLLVALVSAGCTNERAEALRKEIAELHESRVERSAIEAAHREREEAEARLASLRADLEAEREALSGLETEGERLRAALAAEGARNEHVRNRIEEVAEQARQTAARGQELDRRIGQIRQEAGWVCEQADVLARELRPDDPTWATARRLDTLLKFLKDVAERYPDDPVVAELAAEPIDVEQPGPGAAEAGSETARRLRDRFSNVYELAPDVASR